jgi:Uma2 family endonuclease
MNQAIEDPIEEAVNELTVADLFERFGPIPLHRIRFTPTQGVATEKDVVAIDDHENRLCELEGGFLVEKTMGAYESYLAMIFGTLLNKYVQEHNLGIVLGTDGMIRFAPGLVLLPDVSFISWDRLPGRKVPHDSIYSVIPDLAIEVISRGNTKREMEQKLVDYFSAGVRQVWYVYPKNREFHVFRSPQDCSVLTDRQTLEGGDILPGFSLEVKSIFPE